MITTTDPKSKPGTPQHSSGHEEHEAAAAQAGPAPRAAATQTLILSNSSITPGPLWLEYTNTAAFALTVGANTMTGNLPIAGAAYLLQQFSTPPGNLLLMATCYPGVGPITSSTPGVDPTLPVPQLTQNLTNQTALPATAGIRNVTVALGPPATVTINIFAQTAGTVPAGSRWLIFSAVGV